jgi:hypothetical protein
MKYFKSSLLTLAFLSIISLSAFADTTSVDESATLINKIENYISTIDQDKSAGATLYAHFLVKENGFIYSVDFMLTETGEIIVLSKDDEEEFYRVDSFNADHIEKYNIAVADIAE